MARRGPKGVSPASKKARGTEQKCRKVEVLFADHASRPDPDVIPPPVWLGAEAAKIWVEKVARYRQRGQKVEGFEPSLAQYCALEAELIDMRQRRIVPPMAMVSAYRIWAAEFYDTPASQKVPAGGSKQTGNKFARNGNGPQ